jgi:adenylate cyclase
VETIGDAVLVVFGAFNPLVKTAKIAIDAALDLQRGVVEMNKRSELLGLPQIVTSIGIATGPTLCTVVGIPKLQSYSIRGSKYMIKLRTRDRSKRDGSHC